MAKIKVHDSRSAVVGQVAAFGACIREGQRITSTSGSIEEPWLRHFFEASIDIFAQSIPWKFLLSWAVSLNNTSKRLSSPDMLTAQDSQDDWAVVQSYLKNCSSVIFDQAPLCTQSEAGHLIVEPTLSLLYFDQLAALVSPAGAIALERAGRSVHASIALQSSCPIDHSERALLEVLAQGVPIIDAACRLGYSRSTVNRRLKELRSKLGVATTIEAATIAAAEGWIRSSCSSY